MAQYTINQEILKRSVNTLGKMPGLMGAIALEKETGKVLADRIVLRVKKEDLEEMVKTVFRVSQNASLRMDVGAFTDGRVSGSFGNLSFLTLEGVLLAVLTEASAQPQLVDTALQEIKPSLANAVTLVK